MKIVIADSNEIVRDSISWLIEKTPEMSVAGVAVNGIDALCKAKTMTPDAMIIDALLPVLNGIDTTRLIRHASPDTKIIIMSISKKKAYIDKSFHAGATGYICKLSPSRDIIRALKTTARNRCFISPSLRPKRLYGDNCNELSSIPCHGYELLSNREQQIFRLIVEGHSLQSIALKLSLCLLTVEKYRETISSKINAYDIGSMIRFAETIGIIEGNVLTA